MVARCLKCPACHSPMSAPMFPHALTPCSRECLRRPGRWVGIRWGLRFPHAGAFLIPQSVDFGRIDGDDRPFSSAIYMKTLRILCDLRPARHPIFCPLSTQKAGAIDFLCPQYQALTRKFPISHPAHFPHNATSETVHPSKQAKRPFDTGLPDHPKHRWSRATP